MAVRTRHNVTFSELLQFGLVADAPVRPTDTMMACANDLAKRMLRGTPKEDISIRQLCAQRDPAIARSGGSRQRVSTYADAIVRHGRAADDQVGLLQPDGRALPRRQVRSRRRLTRPAR